MRSAFVVIAVCFVIAVGAVLDTTQARSVAATGAEGCCPERPSAAKTTALDTGGTAFYLIGAAHVPGFNGTEWRTSLEVCNFGGATRSFELGFLLRGQANPDPERVELSLAPGLCANYPDVVATVFGLDEAVGTLRLEADGDGVVATARTYNDTPDGTYGTSLGTSGTDEAVVVGETMVLIHLAQSATDDEGFRTNLDLLNVTASAIDVETTLFSSDGTLLGALSTRLEPYEYHQKTKVFRKVTEQEVADGYATVKTTTAGGAFLAAASLVDNRTGDTTTIAGEEAPSTERWLEAVNLGPTINSAGRDWYPVLASDGSFMIFVSDGRGGYGSGDFFISRFVEGEWQMPQNMGPNINTEGFESAPFLSRDDRTLYFASTGGGINHSMDVWRCPLVDGAPQPRERVSGLNTGSTDCCPVLSPDGSSIYICSDRPGTHGALDVWVSHRSGGQWQEPVNLGPVVNTTTLDSPRWISDDGNTMVIATHRMDGGFGASDLWYIVRNGGEWSAPVNLGASVNTYADEWGADFLGNDGRIGGRIFFGSGRRGGYGGWDIYYSDFGMPISAKTGDGRPAPVRLPSVDPLPPSTGCCGGDVS